MKKQVNEVTSTSTGSRGSYVTPWQPGIRYFKKDVMEPFTEPVSEYKSPDLEYDSYDGKMERTKKQRKKEESNAVKAYNKIKNNPYSTFSDEDGNVINQTPGKGKNFVPIKEWVELDKIDLNEDLAVWFGKKKKPKGSKQPKGPWVNICRKVDGKHPPCGRSDTSKGAYPKCRAAGVAGKMSDSEKKAACQQKRRAEKKDTQTGKGQKPIMTSYKKKKTNEDMKRIVRLTENDLSRIVKKVLLEQERGQRGDIIMQDYRTEKNKDLKRRPMMSQEEMSKEINNCNSVDNKKECEENVRKRSLNQWKDVFYGYCGKTTTDQVSVVIAKGYIGGNDTGAYEIKYICGDPTPTYYKNDYTWTPNSLNNEQRQRDRNWLMSWCNSIDWDSRVGQQRKMFRNPKIY